MTHQLQPTRARAVGDRAGDVLMTIGLGALFLAVWPVLLAVRAAQPINGIVVTAHVAGMLAGYGVVVLVALMSRLPGLERGVGADRLARWHGRGGRIVLLLVIAHATAAIGAWSASRHVPIWRTFWQVVRLPWLFAATLATVVMIVVAIASVRAARRRIGHERWHSIHLLAYLAVAASFMHELAGPDLVGHRVLQVAWALLYTGVFAAVVQHRVITPLRNATRHRLRVSAVVPEASGVVSVLVAGEHLDELAAGAGQFFRWRFLTPDLWRTAHPFSLSAAPSDSQLRLTVKALGDGSTSLQRLEPGTWVVAEGPYGAITSDRRTHRDVLLFAGGVGITPMRALFEAMPLSAGQDLLLLYRARTLDDIIFRSELEDIARRRGARLQYLLSDRVRAITPELLRWYAPNLHERDVYLCGPAGLAAAVRRSLRGAGLPSGQLHEERFDF